MPVTLFQRPRLKINIKIHKMEFTETTAVPINLFAIRSLRLCQKIPWHRGKPYPPLYFALMHFLGPPQAHSPARVSRSISSIYKAPGGGKIDVAAHNARGLVGWRARELFLPSPSASSPTLSLLFFFFYFLRSRSWLEQREVRVFVTGDNSLAGELQHRRCNPHGRHGAQSNLISRWITETDRLDAID